MPISDAGRLVRRALTAPRVTWRSGRCQAHEDRPAQDIHPSCLRGILGGIDGHAVCEGRRLRRASRIPFGVAGAGRGQDGGPLPLDRGPLAPMDDRRRQPPEAAVPMLRMIPVKTAGTTGAPPRGGRSDSGSWVDS